MIIKLNDLKEEDIVKAIESEDKDSLTTLLLSKYREAKENNVIVKDFYYAPYVACSVEDFDMFSSSGLKSLFELYEYETEAICLGKDDNDIHFGEFVVTKGDFAFKMDWVESMHDSLYADFVDAKTARMVMQGKDRNKGQGC